jgi:hypothetical protein
MDDSLSDAEFLMQTLFYNRTIAPYQENQAKAKVKA